MRALTIRQPWASLLASGAKRIETRSWQTKYRGPVMIHAGASNAKAERQLEEVQPFVRRLNRETLPGQSHIAVPLPRGQVIAVADLVDVLPVAELEPSLQTAMIENRDVWMAIVPELYWSVENAADPVDFTRFVVSPDERLFGDYTPGRFGWMFANVRRLANPVPASGALSLWTPTTDVLMPVLAQVDA